MYKTAKATAKKVKGKVATARDGAELSPGGGGVVDGVEGETGVTDPGGGGVAPEEGEGAWLGGGVTVAPLEVTLMASF